MIYSKIEIAEMLLLSENTVKDRIKLFGLVPYRKGTTPTHYFDEEQIELIKENRYIDYQKFTHTIETFFIYESKLNFN
jgi:hypothetical protein